MSERSLVRIDVSPVYDFLQGLKLLVQPPRKGRWLAWVEQVKSAFVTGKGSTQAQATQWNHITFWFGGTFPLGTAYVSLAPLHAQQSDVEMFLQTLERLSLADFLRIAVTAGPTDPETPLDSATLLSLTTSRVRTQAFADSYLRFIGKQRSQLLQVVADPETARSELLQVLRSYYERVFSQLEPQIQAERMKAGEQLHTQEESLHRWFEGVYDLRNFSPVILAPSVLVDTDTTSYIHETQQSLLDNSSYEPLILIAGTQRIFGTTPQKRRSNSKNVTPMGPAEQWANAFAALADASRLRLIHLLSERPRYQQELAALMNMSGATISHHVSALVHVGLVRLEREGHRTYIVLRTETLTTLLNDSRHYMLGTSEPQQESEQSS